MFLPCCGCALCCAGFLPLTVNEVPMFKKAPLLRAATVSRDERRAAGGAAASCGGAWSTLSRLRQLPGAGAAAPPASSPTAPESSCFPVPGSMLPTLSPPALTFSNVFWITASKSFLPKSFFFAVVQFAILLLHSNIIFYLIII